MKRTLIVITLWLLSGLCVALHAQTGGQVVSGGPGASSSGLPALPTSPNGVPQGICSTPSGGVGGAAAWCLAGVVPTIHTCPSNLDAIAATDRASLVIWTDASPCASSLPQAGSTGFTSNDTIPVCNQGAGTVTLTPTVSTYTIFAGGAPSTGQTSATFTTGQCATIYSDNVNFILVYKGGTSYPDITDNAGSNVTFGVPIVTSAGSGTAPSVVFNSSGSSGFWGNGNASVCYVAFGSSSFPCDVWFFDQGAVTVDNNGSGINGYFFSNNGHAETSANIDSGLDRLAAKFVGVAGSSTFGDATGALVGNGGFGVLLKSTAAITGPVPVKADTANANQVVVTTTTDTGGGLVLGVCANSPGAGSNCFVQVSGIYALTLGTGTCAIGNFVIVDTTTNGRVKCTATYGAGTVIGVAMAANSTVGTASNVMVGLR